MFTGSPMKREMSAAEHISKRESEVLSLVRALANQAFSRAAGAPLIPGNRIRLLKDSAENYPARIEAIRAARQAITALEQQAIGAG
jgi:cardiolipin synthase